MTTAGKQTASKHVTEAQLAVATHGTNVVKNDSLPDNYVANKTNVLIRGCSQF